MKRKPRFARLLAAPCAALAIAASMAAGPAAAQVPALAAVPTETREPERGVLEQQRRDLAGRLATLRQRAQELTAACAQVEKDSAAAQRCLGQRAELDAQRGAYVADAEAFNARARAASAPARDIEAERQRFREQPREWLDEKQALVRAAVAAGGEWTKAVLLSLRYGRPPATDGHPKRLADLQPGDVLLVAPAAGLRDGAVSRLVAITDQFYTGRVFASGQAASPVSHALTFVGRTAGGRMLFLDNTSGRGSHIIGDTEFRQEYAARELFVARPQAVVEGREMLRVALAAAQETPATLAGSGYGVFGRDAVCSERAALAVAKASGRDDLYPRRLGAIDITPADFFDEQHVGKYFVISPIAAEKSAGAAVAR